MQTEFSKFNKKSTVFSDIIAKKDSSSYLNNSADTFKTEEISLKSRKAKTLFRRFSNKVTSAIVAICCIFGFFEYFTFGEAIYIDGEKIAVVSSETVYRKAVNYASETAVNSGTEKPEFSNLKLLPTVTLKSDISSAKALSEKILLSSGDYVSGCTLYSGSAAVFSCASSDVAEKVVNKYIAQYSMNGDATLSSNLTYKPEVLTKSSISSAEECYRLLSENGSIDVISVVNTTESKVLPFETKTVDDNTLYIGDTITQTEGKNGTAEISHRTVYENGLQQSSLVTSEQVTLKPVNQVIKVGTKFKEVLKTGLFYPLNGPLSSPFGSRWGRMHEGIDIAVSEGTPVKAAECGVVSYVSENAGGYGKFVKINHGHGVETSYAHLSQINVSEGDTVSAETVIALSGNTGRSTGPHLHFEITENDTPVDPLKYLK